MPSRRTSSSWFFKGAGQNRPSQKVDISTRKAGINNLTFIDWLVVPFLICAVAQLLIGYRPGFSADWIPLPLVGLYLSFFWGVAFAGIRTAYASLVLGLVFDIASGGPWGPVASMHVITFGLSIMAGMLLKSASELGLWMAFCIISAVAMVIYAVWATMHIGFGHSYGFIFLWWLITSLCYVPLGGYFGRRRLLFEIIRFGNLK